VLGVTGRAFMSVFAERAMVAPLALVLRDAGRAQAHVAAHAIVDLAVAMWGLGGSRNRPRSVGSSPEDGWHGDCRCGERRRERGLALVRDVFGLEVVVRQRDLDRMSDAEFARSPEA